MNISEVIQFENGQVRVALPPACCLKIAAGLNRAAVNDEVNADELEALAGMFYAAGRAAFGQRQPEGVSAEGVEESWERLLGEVGYVVRSA